MSPQGPNGTSTLLICSLGGTPEPVVASIRYWKPDRINFVCTTQSRETILRLFDLANDLPAHLSRASTDETPVTDPQDLKQAILDLYPLERAVGDWLARDDGPRIIVDFTGGTKVMSAALALLARRWKCTFSYIGGDERSKGGVGTVVGGSEHTFSHFNPWDCLGYQAVEEAVSLFNNGRFSSAVQILDRALKASTTDSEVKRTLATLQCAVNAYAAWDCFNHKTAQQKLEHVLKNCNDLKILFPADAELLPRLRRHQALAAELAGCHASPTRALVVDLMNNACRRAVEGRYDDAVARLYRAIEAYAQIQLLAEHQIDTKAVSREQLPHTLQEEWANRGNGDALKLGLQDAYRLLQELGDDVGLRFAGTTLGDPKKSPLVARNNSILAHGFSPIDEAPYDRLYEMARKVTGYAPRPQDEWRLPKS